MLFHAIRNFELFRLQRIRQLPLIDTSNRTWQM